MKLETRLAALRAAQAVAGLAVASSCSPAPPPQAATVPAGEVPSRPLAPASSSSPGAAESCAAQVDRFFPDDKNDYDPTHRPIENAPANVQRCCVAALVEPGDPRSPPIPQADADRIMNRHRWSCCRAVVRPGVAEKLAIACTPWGPPVPPPMRRPRLVA